MGAFSGRRKFRYGDFGSSVLTLFGISDHSMTKFKFFAQKLTSSAGVWVFSSFTTSPISQQKWNLWQQHRDGGSSPADWVFTNFDSGPSAILLSSRFNSVWRFSQFQLVDGKFDPEIYPNIDVMSCIRQAVMVSREERWFGWGGGPGIEGGSSLPNPESHFCRFGLVDRKLGSEIYRELEPDFLQRQAGMISQEERWFGWVGGSLGGASLPTLKAISVDLAWWTGNLVQKSIANSKNATSGRQTIDFSKRKVILSVQGVSAKPGRHVRRWKLVVNRSVTSFLYSDKLFSLCGFTSEFWICRNLIQIRLQFFPDCKW